MSIWPFIDHMFYIKRQRSGHLTQSRTVKGRMWGISVLILCLLLRFLVFILNFAYFFCLDSLSVCSLICWFQEKFTVCQPYCTIIINSIISIFFFFNILLFYVAHMEQWIWCVYTSWNLINSISYQMSLLCLLDWRERPQKTVAVLSVGANLSRIITAAPSGQTTTSWNR